MTGRRNEGSWNSVFLYAIASEEEKKPGVRGRGGPDFRRIAEMIVSRGRLRFYLGKPEFFSILGGFGKQGDGIKRRYAYDDVHDLGADLRRPAKQLAYDVILEQPDG